MDLDTANAGNNPEIEWVSDNNRTNSTPTDLGFSSKSSETQNIEAENSKEGVGLNRNCFHMWSKIIVEMRRKMMGLMEMLAKIMEDYKF